MTDAGPGVDSHRQKRLAHVLKERRKADYLEVLA